MSMMSTIDILRHNCMAPEGRRKYGVKCGKSAIVFVEEKKQAKEITDTMNKIRLRLPKWRMHRTSFYRPCVGPDHRWLGRFAPPLMQ